MIKKIAHLADIHLRKTPTRNDEYEHVFNNLVESLKEEKPDRIVLVGDFVHDYLALGTEQVKLGKSFLKNLSSIAKTIIIRGNHDCLLQNLKRTDSVDAIVNTLETQNVVYFDETNFYEDENVVWAVWHYGSKMINPWRTKGGKEILKSGKKNDYVYIDLFHDKINNTKTPVGYVIQNGIYSASDFLGDYALLGDIHLMQFLNDEKTKAYPGSLIAQKFDEGDEKFHGYLLWDIENKDVKPIPVKNEKHKFINITLTPDTNFENPEFLLEKNIEKLSLRFIWKTNESDRTSENERKLKKYVEKQHNNVKIYNKNDFLKSEDIKVKETNELRNILDSDVQHRAFFDYLKMLGLSKEKIKYVIKLDKQINTEINEEDYLTYEWDVVKFGGRNFMSYEKFDLDWSDKHGLFQIMGNNATGKTTLAFKFIPFMLFGKTLETKKRVKHGDVRYINNRNNANFTENYLILLINNEYYAIKKRIELKRNKSDEISEINNSITYHRLNDINDEITEENNIDELDENSLVKIKQIISSIVGGYDNFMRVVLTTSDTMNDVLSSDMSEYMDALLFDSGLDVFDKKLEIAKKLEKKRNSKGRVNCDVNAKEEEINQLEKSCVEITNEIKEDNKKKEELQDLINELNDKISNYKESLYKIDLEISNLSVDETLRMIESNKGFINENQEQINALLENNKELPDDCDEERINYLEKIKEEHREWEYKIKMLNLEQERSIDKYENDILLLESSITQIKTEGAEIKEKIKSLKESDRCDKCGSLLGEEHMDHINNEIKKLREGAYGLKDLIEEKKKQIEDLGEKIEKRKGEIQKNKEKIEKESSKMDSLLSEIGELKNQKNDYKKKKENELKIRELKVEIDTLVIKNKDLTKKIDEHKKSLTQIEENEKTRKKIELSENELRELNEQRDALINKIWVGEANKDKNKEKILEIENLIDEYKKQELADEVFKYYKKCVHREGIPKQILINQIIPKMNRVMRDLLESTEFIVWLDENTLKPMFAYKHKPDAAIDCIGSSGKERSFSSIVLKFALNQINIKSKPKLFMLDEIMGKLDQRGVDEFSDLIQNIKNHMNRVVVVEHNHVIYPDYIINVKLNKNELSEIELTQT